MMRKYFIGFIIGVFLTLPFSALAEEVSNVGKRIAAEFTVLLDGEKLPVKAVAFEGTSYAPVRAVGEALGLDVDFEDGVVILQRKNKKELKEFAEQKLRELANDGKLNSLEAVNNEIRSTLLMVEALRFTVNDELQTEEARSRSQERLKELEGKLEQLEQLKTELESQLQAAE